MRREVSTRGFRRNETLGLYGCVHPIYRTKSGQAIQMVFEEDTNPVSASAWVLHKITAFVDEIEVGYLKMSYIPQATWEKLYPTVWHFAREFQGKVSLNPEGTDLERWEQLQRHAGFWSTGNVKKDLKRFAAKLGREMQDSVEFHVDKPLVDYIAVKPYLGDEGRTWKRRGIGLALYECGGRTMAERGLALWASGLQSEMASAAWAFMEARGYPIKYTTGPNPFQHFPSWPRKFLDYRL